MWKIAFKLIILWSLGFCAYLYDMRSDNITSSKTDGIIVLTGAKGRINLGLDILFSNQAQRMLITGVRNDFRLDSYLKENYTVLRPQIDLGYQAFNTAGNALEAKEWIEKNRLSRVVLVTSDYHKRRALLEFFYLLPTLKIVPTTTNSSDETPNVWRLVLKLCREYNKLIGSMLRFLIYKIYDISSL